MNGAVDPVLAALTAPDQPFAIGERDGLRQFVNMPANLNLAAAEPAEGESASGVPAGGVIPKARIFGRRRIAWTRIGPAGARNRWPP